MPVAVDVRGRQDRLDLGVGGEGDPHALGQLLVDLVIQDEQRDVELLGVEALVAVEVALCVGGRGAIRSLSEAAAGCRALPAGKVLAGGGGAVTKVGAEGGRANCRFSCAAAGTGDAPSKALRAAVSARRDFESMLENAICGPVDEPCRASLAPSLAL